MHAPAPNSSWTLDQFYAGARACIPVAISVSAYGVVWGVLAKQAGLSLLEVVLMSGLVFAGSAQFVALDLWTTHARQACPSVRWSWPPSSSICAICC